jgi:hypothetical protein
MAAVTASSPSPTPTTAPAVGGPLTFSLLPASAAMAACMPGATAQVTVVPGSQGDTLTLHADHLPAFSGFELFVTALPHPPYGPAWPISALHADDQGNAETTVQAQVLGLSSLALPGAATPVTTPAGHLVLFFQDLGDAGACGTAPGAGFGQASGPAALATTSFADAAGPLLRPPFALPGLGISRPSGGHGLTSQVITFTSTCTDPNGWTAIRFVDFRFTAAGHDAFWVRLDRPAKRMYVYDTASARWQGPGTPGSGQVLRTRNGALFLRASAVLGSAGTTGRVVWSISFAPSTRGQTLQQNVRVTDLRYQTRGWNPSGTWIIG